MKMSGGMKIIRIDVIATTISGSISDWQKVKRIIPLFAEHGFGDVRLHEVNSHTAAREAAYAALKAGGRIPISAGGSGTFRAVLEGCIDSGVNLADIRLGFLRKGSADLIGKVLNMPDDIENAIDGNLCRCCCYPNIIKATLAASKNNIIGERKNNG